MPPSLHPLVAERLSAFGQRWTRLVWARGICAAAVVWLGTFSLVAWLDWRFALTEGTRWLLSLAGYAATAAVFWRVAGRKLWVPPSARELAGLVEKAWPGLRNHLVAAVELAEGSAEGKHDSFEFRDLVQDEAAARIKDVQMEVLLPRSLMSGWANAAVLCALLVAGLLVVPSLGFPRQLLRAALPMAAIERVTRTKIQVLEPAADTRWLAQGDRQAVVVALAGTDTDRAELEVIGAEGRTERMVMSASGDRQFTATVPVGAGTFSFRVRAGDALTQTVKIATRMRPAVFAFTKTYEPPAYAQWPSRTVEEEHGHLTALAGSVVDLRMRINQAVRAGEVTVVAEGRTNLITLSAPEVNVVQARVPVRGTATYQVRLVAAETGLGNQFSPTFEIRAEPDLAPRVTLETPRTDLVVASDEVVTVNGTAADDVGLASVAQQFQINTGPWLEVPLALANRTNSPVTHRWDLLLLGLATGDRIATRLVAVDLKGTRAESAPAQLVVGAEPSGSKRAKSLAARQQLQEALEATGKAAAELRKAYTSEAIAKIREGDDVQRQQTVAGAGVALTDVQRQLDRAAKQLDGAMREADAGREAAELTTLGNALSAARRDLLPRAQLDREALAKEMRELPERSNVNEAVKSAQRLADFTAQMAAGFSDLVVADQADALTERLDQLAKEQQRAQQLTAGAGADTNAWQRVARREAGAVRETAQAEQQMAELRQRAPRQMADRLGRTQDNLKAARSSVAEGLNNQPGPELAAPTRQLKNATEQAASDTRQAGRELATRADKARSELAKLTEPSAEKIARLRRDLERLADSEKKLAEAKKNGDADVKLKLKAESERERAEASWRSAMEQLEDRAKSEEVRRDSDPQFAAQLGQTRDALEAMRAAADSDWQNAASTERLSQMEKALRGLEAGRQLSELEGAAAALARQERFDPSAPENSTSRPRDWNWLEKQMPAVQRETRNAGLGDGVASALSEAMRSNAGQQIGREMAERRSGGGRTPTSMANQLDQVAGQMQRVQSEAARAAADARQALARTTPSLSERLLGLSRAAAELEGDLKRVAVTATSEQVTNLHAHQTTLNVRLGDAASAIRRDANAQDLSQAAGRERARDADVAIEMLREPPVKAEAALVSATTARVAARAKALNEAAREDKTLADRLKMLGEHYRNLEAGAAEVTRMALRKQEDALGMRAAQDQRYAQMERLQQMASLSPEEQQRALAAELARNPAMRAELARMSRDAVGEARQRLQDAAETERGVQRQLERAANPALELGELWEQLRLLVEAMRRTVKEELPPVQTAAEKLRLPVHDELVRGGQALTEAADKAPTQTNLPPATVAQRVSDMLPGLQRATNELGGAERKATEADKKFAEAQKKLAEPQRDATRSAEWSALSGRSGALAAFARRHLDRARALAEGFANVGKTPAEQTLARAAQQQGEVAGQLREAASQLQRAGRDERAIGNEAGASALQRAAQQAQASADQADRARRAAQDGQNAAQAGQTAGQLGSQLEQQRAGLEQVSGTQSGNPGRKNAQSGEQVAQSADQSGSRGTQAGAQPAGQQTSAQQAGQSSAQTGSPQTGQPAPSQNGQPSGQPSNQPGGQQGNQQAGAQQSGQPSSQQDGQSAGQQSGQPTGESTASQGGQPSGQSSSQPRSQAGSQPGSPQGDQSGRGSTEGQGGSSPGGRPSVDASNNGSGATPPGAGGPEGSSGNAQAGRQVQGQAASAPPPQGRGGGGPNNVVVGSTGAAQKLNGTRARGSGGGGGDAPMGAPITRIHSPGGAPDGNGGVAFNSGRNDQPDARWMARAFDGLGAGNPDAARAMEAARQAQEQALRQNRGASQSVGNSPAGAGDGSGTGASGRVGGASRAGGGSEFGPLPELGPLRDADWAKLPPKLAQDLRDAQQNSVSGDYRVLVDAYFKAVAERARK